MRQRVLLDTGPLVAFINRNDRFHGWARESWEQIEPPLLTCEAVITEACFLLRTLYDGQERVLSLVAHGVIQVSFYLNEDASAVKELLTRYQSVPMSYADACLVRMAERYSGGSVLTLDSDFKIYRKYKNQEIPIISPEFRS